MRTRKLLAVAFLLLIVAAACTNEPEPSGGGEPAGGGGQTGAAGETPFEHLNRALAGEFEGTTVEVLAQWIDAEGDNFDAVLQPFAEQTGIEVNYEGLTDYETVLTARVEGGNAPDLAQVAQPGLMQSFQASGDLVNLSEWINVDQIEQDYSSVVDLAEVDGNIYGLFFKADLKSIVWYPVRAFEDAGYAVPTTWDELMALQDQIKADGGTPWCIGMEHGDATGWVATDWIEDVLLRTAPVEVYDQWVAHEIPFNSPEVLEAAGIVSQIWFDDGNVFGGNTAINNVFVGHAMNDMFARPEPKCWLHKQASWIPSFWPGAEEDPPDPQFEPGVDSTFFYLPPIEEEFGNPVLGGADMIVMFNDRPEVRALLEYLATPEAPLPWIEAGGFVSPNQSVPDSAYTTFPSSGLGPILSQATTLRFDASDAMPAEVGQGTFWSGMVDWVSDEGQNTEQIFQQIEESWPSG